MQSGLQVPVNRTAGRTLPDLNRAVELDPRDPGAYQIRARLRRYSGDYNGARAAAFADYNRAITLNPACAPCYSNRGLSRLMLGDHVGAVKDIDRAIELDPRVARYNSYRDQAVTGALEDLDRALTLNPKLADSWLVKGTMEITQGSFVTALKSLTRHRAPAFARCLQSPWPGQGPTP